MGLRFQHAQRPHRAIGALPGPAELRRTLGIEYAEERRRVSPVEQQVHSVLEMSPVTVAFLLTALHWDQALALAGQDSSRPRFAIRLKRRDPLVPSARAVLLAAIALFGVLPYAEELWRCWRARPTVKPLDKPAEPATETLQR